MKLFSLIKKSAVLLVAGILLSACGAGGSSADGSSEGLYEDDVLTIGVTAGPHEDILNLIKERAAEDGFNIEVVTFNDFVPPNTALAEGSLDLNSMQTGPYLENVINQQGFDFVDVAPTITLPMAVHSYDYNSVEELPEGAQIGIPNTPTQEGRALQLIEETGLITLPEGSDLEVTVDDIVENPKNIEFITSDPAQLPVQLEDLDAAAINSNYAFDSGLGVTEYSIASESDQELLRQANLIVARSENQDDEAIQRLIDYYHTDEVQQFIEETYDGAVVPAWELNE